MKLAETDTVRRAGRGSRHHVRRARYTRPQARRTCDRGVEVRVPAISEYFKTVGEWDDGVHRFRVITPDHADWLTGLAELYRELRTASRVPIGDLGLTGLEGFDVEDLQAALVATQVPTRHSGSPKVKHMAVERSDIGELVLALIGELKYGYNYGYRSVRDRELVKLPGRGIDQIGVLELDLTNGERAYVLSLGEAKVSIDKNSPPAVVDGSKDCLRVQHRGHLTESAESIQKVLGAARHTADRDTARQLFAAGMLWRQGSDKVTLRSTSMLVRDRNHQPTDFGSFRASPSDYDPGHIDFTILVIDTGDIEELVDEFLALARQEAA